MVNSRLTARRCFMSEFLKTKQTLWFKKSFIAGLCQLTSLEFIQKSIKLAFMNQIPPSLT
jgi:hypothetical protein